MVFADPPFCAAIICICLCGAAQSQQFDTEAKGRKLAVHVSQKLNKEQRTRISEFKDGTSFYAAYAASLQDFPGGAFGWVGGAHSLEAAQEAALRSCQFYEEVPGSCILIASVVPVNRPPAPDGSGMNYQLTKKYKSLVKNLAKKKNGNYALAFNDYNAWWWSGKQETPESAKQVALTKCDHYASQAFLQKDKGWEDAVIDPARKKCRIRYFYSAGSN